MYIDFSIQICIVNQFKEYLVCSNSQTYLIIELFLNDSHFEKSPLTEGQTVVPTFSTEISNFHGNLVMKKNLNCVLTTVGSQRV